MRGRGEIRNAVTRTAKLLGLWMNGWVFTNKGGGYEYPVFWAIACFVLTLLGDGAGALKPGAPWRTAVGAR